MIWKYDHDLHAKGKFCVNYDSSMQLEDNVVPQQWTPA